MTFVMMSLLTSAPCACNVMLSNDLGVHELPPQEHGGVEHWERAARLHRRLVEHSTDVHSLLQQQSVLYNASLIVIR